MKKLAFKENKNYPKNIILFVPYNINFIYENLRLKSSYDFYNFIQLIKLCMRMNGIKYFSIYLYKFITMF